MQRVAVRTDVVKRQTGAPQPGDAPGTTSRWPAVAACLPAVLLLITWMIWTPSDGAYFPDAWYPSAIGVGALLLITIVAGGRILPQLRSARVGLLGFTALVALNYLSILWAGSPGSALEASNELLLYLMIAWVYAIVPWTSKTLTTVLAVWSVSAAVFCAVGLANAAGTAHPASYFYDYRFSDPLGYPNATGAFAAMAMWPALILSTRPELARWLRVLLLPVALFLAEFAFLPQSRGVLVGLGVTVPLALIVCRGRIRLLARMLVVGAGLAISVPQSVDVNNAATPGGNVTPALHHAALGMLLTSVGALVVGALLMLLEPRLEEAVADRRRGRTWTISRQVRVGLALLAGVALIGGGIAAGPAVGHAARSVWHEGKTDAEPGSVRLLSGAPEERVDYLRVGWHLFEDSPVGGIGAGNFGRRYDGLKHFQKHSQYAHNLPLRTLSENGVVGFALLVAVAVALLVGLFRAARDEDGLGAACAVAALAVAAYFLAHASFDWLDEYPVLAAPPLAFAVAALALRRQRVGSPPATRTRLARLRPEFAGRLSRPALRWVGLTAAAVAIALALLPAYLSTRYVQQAFAVYRTKPATAYHYLSRASSLNPLSADPLISKGTIALQLGDPVRARAAFQSANSREPTWYSELQLALLDSDSGQFGQAQMELRRAESLDVDDPVLASASSLIARRKRVNPVKFDQSLLQGAQQDVFAVSRLS